MKKLLLSAFVVVTALVGTVAASPSALSAQDTLVVCPCNGGCERLAYYNDCGNGQCSWFCA